MLSRVLILAGMVGVSGCGNFDDDIITVRDEPIIGGSTDNGDPSVVAVFAHPPNSSSGSLCTGTVIGPRTVLTAAHCVDPREVGSGQVFQVLVGTTLTLTGALAVSGTAFDPAFNPNNITGGHDVGIVTLAQPTSLAAIPYNKNALPASTTGSSVRLVGYGSNTHKNGGAGTKRSVSTVVDDFNSLVLHIGNSNQQTCHGDSGGPAFQVMNGVETVVGITSYGQDRSSRNVCLGGGYDTRVDDYTAFIQSHLQ